MDPPGPGQRGEGVFGDPAGIRALGAQHCHANPRNAVMLLACRTTDCDGFHNEYTAAFASVLTRGLDWRAYCEARKAGTDKGASACCGWF